MPNQRQLGFVRRHSASVVYYANAPFSPSFHFDANPGRARVKRVLAQLFDDRRGSLHDLARGDLIDYVIGENGDACHNPYNIAPR
jgi:hypothetical protein